MCQLTHSASYLVFAHTVPLHECSCVSVPCPWLSLIAHICSWRVLARIPVVNSTPKQSCLRPGSSDHVRVHEETSCMVGCGHEFVCMVHLKGPSDNADLASRGVLWAWTRTHERFFLFALPKGVRAVFAASLPQPGGAESTLVTRNAIWFHGSPSS